MKQLLRGDLVSGLLRGLGIDPKRYWLLVDLFGALSERGEMLDQLGTNEVALGMVTRIYAVFTAILAIVLVATGAPLAAYSTTFLILTAFLLLSILLSETGNSLVNPVEGLVLAHQPINGATYTGAKLTHLAWIIVYLVLGLNGLPALAGLLLREAGWFYPALHLIAALAIGLVAASLCCALFGWLIRLLPAGRLKAAGQLAGALPLLAIMWWRPVRDLVVSLNLLAWVPERPALRWALGVTLLLAAGLVVAAGIRCLSADYLIRLSGILHGGRARKAPSRKRWSVGGRFGGQPGRAGFEFVSRMALRDFQFRRQVLGVVAPLLLGLIAMVAQGWRTDAFSGRFTPLHLLPHLFGFALLFVCVFLPFGSDFKASWIFLSVQAKAFGRFAHGIHAALWIRIILVPHVVLLALLAWSWGLWHAALFTAYSTAASSVYLALEIRLIDGVPFSLQVDPRRGATLLPLFIVGGLAMALAVALQILVVFRSSASAVAATAVLAGAGYFLTRNSVRTLEAAMRYSLGLLSSESGTLYKEIDI